MTSAHQTLRRTTAAVHHELDHHRLMQRLTRKELTREQYVESLAAMYRPHARLEQQVHDSRHHAESGLELSARLELLAADLRELGCSVPLIPRTSSDPVDGRAAWWGRVYVLEGARLGSAVIAKCIRSGRDDHLPCRFFGQGMVCHDRRALLAMLERELASHEALDQAIASARATFEAYRTGLDAFVCGKHEAEMR